MAYMKLLFVRNAILYVLLLLDMFVVTV